MESRKIETRYGSQETLGGARFPVGRYPHFDAPHTNMAPDPPTPALDQSNPTILFKPQFLQTLNGSVDLTQFTSYAQVKQALFYSKENEERVTATLQTPTHFDHKCGRCGTCNMWKNESGYLRNVTANKKILTKSTENTKCATSNVIYCLECPLCSKVYVGETKQKLNARIRQHRADIAGKGVF